jgi:GH25 family lysozyme M1 (1,4-beta-N-acetylmuramidase)
VVEYGIDISNHQGAFDAGAARREGFTWATAKVTEGDGYRDPWWPRNRDLFREHFPGRFGGYVFCRVASDPQREADAFVAHLGDLSIPVQIDYEDDQRRGSGADLAARVTALRERGCRLLPPYIPRWYWRDHMGSPDLSWLRDLGVWNSHYVSGTGYASNLYPGDTFAGWADVGGAPVKILQFSERGLVAGQSIDVNAFRGSAAELDALFGASPIGGDDEVVPTEVLIGAGQWSAPQVTDLKVGTIGPRPLRNPENYNVRTPDGAWGRAMLMDLWNELVFDGYRSLSAHDPGEGSLVSFVLRTHKMVADLHEKAGLPNG